MMQIIHEKDIKTKKFENLEIKEFVNTETPSVSISKIELFGENAKNKNSESNMYYYVLDGEGVFIIENKRYNVTKGDLICIPKNTVYKDEGNLRMISIGVPRFNKEKEVCIK